MRRLDGQDGSALVEAAILFPVLILVLYWSVALTEVLILKLKASEAARFALWETTVWKSPLRIDQEVRQRFGDLGSPPGIDRAATALLLFPRSSTLRWGAQVDVAAEEVKLAGERVRFNAGPGILSSFLGAASGWMAGGVQAALRAQQFNTFGVASARARLVQAGRTGSTILAGGDPPGPRARNRLCRPPPNPGVSPTSPLPHPRPPPPP